jgi:hypothetical protein
MASPYFLMEGYIMQIELILEKPCDLKPCKLNLLKVDGKKLIVEVEEAQTEPQAEKKNPFWGACADKREALHKVIEEALQDRENKPLRTPKHV